MTKQRRYGSKHSGGSKSFSAYNEACDYLREMWETGHALRSLVYQKSNDDSNNVTELVCSKRTFAILSNVVKVQQPLQDILSESISILQSKAAPRKRGTGDTKEPKEEEEDKKLVPTKVGNSALMLIMAYELLLSKQQKIAGGGAIKRLLLSHEETLRAKVQQNDTLREHFDRKDGTKTTTIHPRRDNAANIKPYHFRLLVKVETAMENTSAREILLHHCTVDDIIPQVYKTTIPKAQIVAHSKLFLIQSQASCLPAYCLYQCLCNNNNNNNNKQSHLVLDACAAPGNKTLQLASYLCEPSSTFTTTGNTKIIALDKDASRYEMLQRRCAHIASIQTIRQDFLAYDNNDQVTAILLDPSCSGGHGGETTTKDRIAQLSSFQTKALWHALTAFPNCSNVVYSTCSHTLEENETVVKQCLEQLQQLQQLQQQQQQVVVEIKCSNPQPPLQWKLISALPEWKMRGHEDCPDETIRMSTLRHMDGFFVAVFQRTIIQNTNNNNSNAMTGATAAVASKDNDNNTNNKRRKKLQWKERQTQAKRQRLRKKQKKTSHHQQRTSKIIATPKSIMNHTADTNQPTRKVVDETQHQSKKGSLSWDKNEWLRGFQCG